MYDQSQAEKQNSRTKKEGLFRKTNEHFSTLPFFKNFNIHNYLTKCAESSPDITIECQWQQIG